jgi:uncharacterized protein (DUF488 family)
MQKILYTIGHSTRTFDEFLALLQAYRIKNVIDIRTIPRSRFNPQFNTERLKRRLTKNKIYYIHLPKLGGLRHSKKDSINTGWINASFRGFADYMQTKDFQEGIKKLITIAQKQPTVIMCAEAVAWRCHRSLIADVLTHKKWQVFHIQSKKTAKLHQLTPFLHIQNHQFIYRSDL